MTPSEAQQIMAAVKELSEISASTIINPKDEAKRAGLITFLHRNLLLHSSELMGCWLAIIQEYQPLCLSFRRLCARAGINVTNNSEAVEEVKQ